MNDRFTVCRAGNDARVDHEPPDDRKRKVVRLLAMSYAVLVLIGLQLVLRFRDDTTASSVVSVIVLAVIVAILLWARRNDLLRRRRS